MAADDFARQLREDGFDVEELPERMITLPFLVPLGPRVGESLTLGFQVPPDFPLSPPSGPHVSPRILPIHPDQSVGHPIGGVHESPFGSDWEYWSRPFPEWPRTDRTARAYMSHVRHLFATL